MKGKVITNRNGVNEEVPEMFQAYEEQILKAAPINYEQQLFYRRNPDDRLRQMHRFNIKMPDDEEVRVILPEREYPEKHPTHLPKWIRKESREDKKKWKQINSVFKRTPKYIAPLFQDIPEVQQAERKFLYESNTKSKQNSTNNQNQDIEIEEESLDDSHSDEYVHKSRKTIIRKTSEITSDFFSSTQTDY